MDHDKTPAPAVLQDRILTGMNGLVAFARELSVDYHRLSQLCRQARLAPSAPHYEEIETVVAAIEEVIGAATEQLIELDGWRAALQRTQEPRVLVETEGVRVRYSSGCETSPRWTADPKADIDSATASLHRSLTLARSAIAAARRLPPLGH